MRNFKNILRIKPRLRFSVKRIYIILCVETSVNTIQFYVFNLTVKNYIFLSLNDETSQQNEKTCNSYSKMFNANDSSTNAVHVIHMYICIF